MNDFVQALRNIVGEYNYTLAPNRIGIASLDFEYITKVLLLLLTVWFIYKMLLTSLRRR